MPTIRDWYVDGADVAHDAPPHRDLRPEHPILRRLTDAEVEALIAPKPGPTERERFVLKCAMEFFVRYRDKYTTHQNATEAAFDAAKALADRLFGEQKP